MGLGYHPPHYLQPNDSQSAVMTIAKSMQSFRLDKVMFHQTPINIDYTLDYVPISPSQYQYIGMCGCNIQTLCDMP